MDLYLYLKEHSFVDAWVHGGIVPFYVASTYKREDRSGIFTPDENLIDESTFDLQVFEGSVIMENCIGIEFENFGYRGKEINGTVTRYHEDGLVVCMSTRRSKFIARKLKKSACVKIREIERLKKIIDEATGVKGHQGVCRYTATHKRHHFLKSTYDSWQEEYRLFWPDVGNIEIDIPPGLAEPVFFLDEK